MNAHATTAPALAAHAVHRIAVADETLSFVEIALTDAQPTARQIIAAARHGDPVDFIVMQWMLDGTLVEFDRDTCADLPPHTMPRFIVVRSDRSYRIELTGRRLEWPNSSISGAVIKQLAGVANDEYDVYLDRRDEPDLHLADDASINLAGDGVERFSLRLRPRTVTISVNNRPVIITRGDHTGLEIKQVAMAQNVPIQMDFILSLDKPDGDAKVIGNRDIHHVRAHDKFTAIADDDNS
jgi:hypothetical protein